MILRSPALAVGLTLAGSVANFSCGRSQNLPTQTHFASTTTVLGTSAASFYVGCGFYFSSVALIYVVVMCQFLSLQGVEICYKSCLFSTLANTTQRVACSTPNPISADTGNSCPPTEILRTRQNPGNFCTGRERRWTRDAGHGQYLRRWRR